MSAVYAFIDGAFLRRHYNHQMQEFYGFVPPMDFIQLGATLDAHRFYYYDAIDYTQDGSESKAVYDARITDAEHAARGNLSKAILLSGDLDFEPLVTSLLRLGIPTTLYYVPLNTSDTLKRAADQIRKMTLEHFHAWGAPSFRQNHKQLKLTYGNERPESQIFRVVQEGSWSGRKVTLFKAINQAPPRLYVDWGNELTERSFLLEYPDIDKLPLAFKLTFGDVQWDSHEETDRP